MGQADVANINVTKILPQVAPIVAIMAKSLTVPDVNTSMIIEDMKQLGQSTALKPLLQLITNSNSPETTISALTTLAPLVVSNENSESMTDIFGLIDNSINATQVFDMLAEEIATSSATSNATELEMSMVLSVLAQSNNLTTTLTSISELMGLANDTTGLEEISYVVNILTNSKNLTDTELDLQTLSSATVSSGVLEQLNETISTSTDIIASLTELEALLPSSEKKMIQALVDLLENSNNSTATITDIMTMMSISSSSSASSSDVSGITPLFTFLNSFSNTTFILAKLPELLTFATTNSTTATQDMMMLQQFLLNSKNNTLSIDYLNSILSETESESSSALTTVSSGAESLLELLQASENATLTLENLETVSKISMENSSALLPMLQIMQASAKASPNITDDYIYENVLPSLFDSMGFATKFNLGIFTLCRTNTAGKIYSCTKSHAVQSFHMKQILFNELEVSAFKPYVSALNLTAEDIQINGILEEKEKEYVPAVKALLAFNLITIIASFFMLISILSLGFVWKSTTNYFTISTNFLLAGCIFGANLISAAVVAGICQIIKHGLKHDKYNVTFEYNSEYWGLIWASFCISVFNNLIFIYITFKDYKSLKHSNSTVVKQKTENESVSQSDSSVIASSNDDIEKNQEKTVEQEKDSYNHK
ncbi:uncharacterized protein SCDLUD_004291 [Saccharomycodes ludwigii]|uniref:uncharacterized protein n=1 Tax=Saccharomycodes ludwigii TaxID=36035 RepID=UPI001E886E95|nr:hypothetical protein SCDLUD_004291 [Saccharomycodes ludwigii]KAH3899975.1 hypothetical protein SCDLUD_004291 [Saccharomycodes ludwigii]